MQQKQQLQLHAQSYVDRGKGTRGRGLARCLMKILRQKTCKILYLNNISLPHTWAFIDKKGQHRK